MVKFVNNLIVSCSKSWWKFLLVLGGQIGTISVLNNITEGFPAISGGHKPFDMQNSLQAHEIFLQLATYTPEAFSQYSLFQMVDYVFPVFGGLVLACAVAFALRHASPILYQRALDTRVLFLLLIPTIFDWLENINHPLFLTFLASLMVAMIMVTIYRLFSLLFLPQSINWFQMMAFILVILFSMSLLTDVAQYMLTPEWVNLPHEIPKKDGVRYWIHVTFGSIMHTLYWYIYLL